MIYNGKGRTPINQHTHTNTEIVGHGIKEPLSEAKKGQ